ncbi:MAG: phosphotransferase [Pseudomonadota bacterium]
MILSTDNQTELTQLARALGWLPADTDITALSIPGAGNMNVVFRARLSNGGSVIFKQAPAYVARFPDIAAPPERLHSEAEFYAAVATDPQLATRIPEIIGYDPEHHLLCLQDLGEMGDLTHVYNLSEPLPQQPLQELLAWLGRLHNLPVSGAMPVNQAMRELNHQHLFVVPLQSDNGVELPEALLQVAETLRTNQALHSSMQRLGEIYLGQRQVTRISMLHGDFYPGSWLSHANGDAQGIKVIDPEFCFAGPAEFDVGVMHAHLLMAGITDAQWQSLLEHYARPPGFAADLAAEFTAVEIIRRILGVAQLPLAATHHQQVQWLEQAGDTLT